MSDLSQPINTGRGVSLWVEGDALMIKYHVWAYGFLGTKRVPATNVTTFDWREPGGLIAGVFQISILGEQPPSAYASPNVRNQNKLIFDAKVRDKVASVRDWLQQRMAAAHEPAAPPLSVADELTKLAQLLSQGLLSRDEFDEQKARLLAGGA